MSPTKVFPTFVTRCNECGHMEHRRVLGYYKCGHAEAPPSLRIRELTLPDVMRTIPDFCPLADAPEVKP